MADIDKIEFPDGTQHNIKDSRIENIEIDQSTLTNGQVLKYDASDDTWKNEDETGGGADYIELTQAQYDNLSYEEKHNGKMYFITDAPSGGGGESSHEYSTTEQVIGTWVDGSPVYEISIPISNSSFSTGWKWFSVNLVCNKLIDSEVYLKDSADAYCYTNLPVCIQYSDGAIGVYNGLGGNMGNVSGHVTVRYIKASS